MFDNRTILYRRKLELNLPDVWPKKLSDRQIERVFSCCRQKKSVLHVEKLHRSCATLFEAEIYILN